VEKNIEDELNSKDQSQDRQFFRLIQALSVFQSFDIEEEFEKQLKKNQMKIIQGNEEET
jgi:hypothetical protein